MKISWNETCSLLAYCVCAHVQVQYTIFDETFSRANFSIHILSAIVSIRPVVFLCFLLPENKKKSEIKFESLFEWTSIRNTHKKNMTSRIQILVFAASKEKKYVTQKVENS